MTKKEEAFWEFYNPIQAMAEKHDVSIYTIVNFREIWDMAYQTGKVDGMNEAIDIVNGKKESN